MRLRLRFGCTHIYICVYIYRVQSVTFRFQNFSVMKLFNFVFRFGVEKFWYRKSIRFGIKKIGIEKKYRIKGGGQKKKMSLLVVFYY